MPAPYTVWGPRYGRTILAMLGALSVIVGCLSPWSSGSVDIGASQRGIDTTLGVMVSGLALLSGIVALLRGPVQRLGLAGLSSSGLFWQLVWGLHTPTSLAYGWWISAGGWVILLLASLSPIVWWQAPPHP